MGSVLPYRLRYPSPGSREEEVEGSLARLLEIRFRDVHDRALGGGLVAFRTGEFNGLTLDTVRVLA